MDGARAIALSGCLLAVCGCAATTYSHRTGDTRVVDAIGEPFRDTGWTRENPPEVLIRAAEAPYALPSDPDCAAILEEVAALDLVLGPDLDAEDQPNDESGARAQGLISGAIAGSIGGLIGLPYRSVIRWASGADRRERTLRDAIFAGMVRRAFLKGVTLTACAPVPADSVVSPAAPEAPPPEASQPEGPGSLTAQP